MPSFKDVTPPTDGQTITLSGGALQVPDRPIIPFIEGDGTGPDIWRASVRVFDAAVKKVFGGKKEVAWMEVYAGEKVVQEVQQLAARRHGGRVHERIWSGSRAR